MEIFLYLQIYQKIKWFLMFIIGDQVTGYEELWFLGDNFMAKSYTDHVTRSDYPLYVTSSFEVSAFGGSRFTCTNTNMLSRIENALIQALNKKGQEKPPRYIVVVLDDDLIDFLGSAEFGISTILGEWIHYLARSLNSAIEDWKKALPVKALEENYPMIYWATSPHHKHFINNTQHTEFNNSLESVLKLYNNMRTIKMKEIWDYENPHLVAVGTGRITAYGLSRYWMSINAAIKYNVV